MITRLDRLGKEAVSSSIETAEEAFRDEVSLGSKCEKLRVSRMSPVSPQ